MSLWLLVGICVAWGCLVIWVCMPDGEADQEEGV